MSESGECYGLLVSCYTSILVQAHVVPQTQSERVLRIYVSTQASEWRCQYIMAVSKSTYNNNSIELM